MRESGVHCRDREGALLAAVFAVVIVYCSLYPFRFHSGLDLEAALMVLSDSWQGHHDLGDFAANVLFYIPLGCWLFRAMPLVWPARIFAVVAAGLALSFVVELVQTYDEGRYASLMDVAANGAGLLLGVAIDGLYAWDLISRPFAALLLVCYGGAEVLQRVQAKSSAAPRLWVSPLGFLDLYSQLAQVVLAGLLLATIAGPWWRRLVAALPRGVYLFCACGIALDRLRPWQFTASFHPPSWVPFLTLIMAPPDGGLFIALHDVYSLGALTWLLARAGLSWHQAVIAGTLLVAVVLGFECFIPGKATEASDLLLLGGLAAIGRHEMGR